MSDLTRAITSIGIMGCVLIGAGCILVGSVQLIVYQTGWEYLLGGVGLTGFGVAFGGLLLK